MKLLITGNTSLTKDDFGNGFETTFVADERIPLLQQGINPANFEAVICNGLFLYNDIELFENLKIIQLTSAGLDRVPIEYINKNGIKLFSARGVYSIPMAEFTVGGILQIYKKAAVFRENQKNKIWNKEREIFELFGKTVAIFGCGSVGGEIAKRLSAFGMKIIGIDVAEVQNEYFDEIYDCENRYAILKDCDIVILTLPLTKETENLADEEFFNNMKQNSLFVNISRGKTVDEQSLLKALDGKLLGAVLDVFETEPLSEESLLWEKENVIITPHSSFIGENNKSRLKKIILRNIK